MTDAGDWGDTFAIQQVIHRYFDAVNRGDLEAVRSVYADDAVWEAPRMGFRHTSADAFVEFLRQTTATAELLVLTPHCPVIRLLDDDAATATTTFHELMRGPTPDDGPFGPAGTAVSFEHYGIYDDDFARVDGSWRFTHRRVVSISASRGVATGDVVTERSALQHLGRR